MIFFPIQLCPCKRGYSLEVNTIQNRIVHRSIKRKFITCLSAVSVIIMVLSDCDVSGKILCQTEADIFRLLSILMHCLFVCFFFSQVRIETATTLKLNILFRNVSFLYSKLFEK